MKDSLKRIKSFFKKDVNEFNKLVLSVVCVTILVVAGIVSYTITNSYAVFTSELQGSKTLKFHPITEYPIYKVDFYNNSQLVNGANLNSGNYSGYCLISNGTVDEAFNSCTKQGAAFGFTSLSDCQSEATRFGGSTNGFSCSSGSWTSNGIDHASIDPDGLNADVFFKYNINSAKRVDSTELCFIYRSSSPTSDSNTEPKNKLTPIPLVGVVGQVYCLNGGDGVYNSSTHSFVSSTYTSNVSTLDDVFGSGICHSVSDGYTCDSNSLYIYVKKSGIVDVSTYDQFNCSLDLFGFSSCASNIVN